jgi:hypothetical protein
MEINRKIEALKGIKRVEAPPYLFTRIEAQIKKQSTESYSKKAVLGYFAGLLLLIILNLSALINFNGSKVSGDDLINAYGLNSNYSLYND